jgi:hypothetical protein
MYLGDVCWRMENSCPFVEKVTEKKVEDERRRIESG